MTLSRYWPALLLAAAILAGLYFWFSRSTGIDTLPAKQRRAIEAGRDAALREKARLDTLAAQAEQASQHHRHAADSAAQAATTYRRLAHELSPISVADTAALRRVFTNLDRR